MNNTFYSGKEILMGQYRNGRGKKITRGKILKNLNRKYSVQFQSPPGSEAYVESEVAMGVELRVQF